MSTSNPLFTDTTLMLNLFMTGNTLVCAKIFDYVVNITVHIVSRKQFLQNFLVILKRMLQNY